MDAITLFLTLMFASLALTVIILGNFVAAECVKIAWAKIHEYLKSRSTK